MQRLRLPAFPVYLLLKAASAFLFATAFTTSAVYRFEMAQLNPLELVLLGTALEGAIFIFEIPTGIVADLYSRRLSVIVGYALIGAGMLLEGSLQLFVTILLAQAVWGIGYTFISGAQDAWLADEMGEEKLTAVYLRGSQVAQVTGFLGIFANMLLARIQLNVPFFLAGGGFLALAIFLMLSMPEDGFAPTPRADRTTWQSMGHTLKAGIGTIRQRPLLLTILGITLIYGLYSEPLDRLWQPHFLENITLPVWGSLEPVVWFGIIQAGLTLVTVAVAEIVRRRLQQFSHRQTVLWLATLSGTLAGGLILFGLATRFLFGLTAYGALSVARSTIHPIYSAWINRGLDPKTRATVLSTFGQVDAIGQVVSGPALGSIALRFGMRAALVGAGLILAPVLAFYARAYRQEGAPLPASEPSS